MWFRFTILHSIFLVIHFLLDNRHQYLCYAGKVLQAVSQVWKSRAPSKVVFFSWQLILDRIPTRLNLSHCGVPLPTRDLGCVFCDAPSESSVQLFLSCPSILPVWYQVSRWLGWEFVIPMDLAQLFLCFTSLGRGKRVMIGLLLV